MLNIKTAGVWQICYTDTEQFCAGSWIDIPGVQSTFVINGSPDVLSVDLRGSNLRGTVNLNGVNYSGTPTLRVYLGGDIRADVGANEADFADCTIGGGIAAGYTVTVGNIGNGTGAPHFGGNLLGTLNSTKSIVSAATLSFSGTGPHSGKLLVASNVAGSVLINGNFGGGIKIGGALSGQIVVSGDVNVAPDPNDPNYPITINQMADGRFECHDMNLNYQSQVPSQPTYNNPDWFRLYWTGSDRSVPQTGTIQINGKLAGTIYCRSSLGVVINADSVDSPTQTTYEPGMYGGGGILVSGSTLDSFALNVAHDFKRGFVEYVGGANPPQTSPFKGAITIGGNMGAPAGVAHIRGRAFNASYPNAGDVQSKITIGGSLYPGADGLPAINCDGTLSSNVRISGSLVYGTVGATPIIYARNALTGAVAVDYNGWRPEYSWQSGATINVDGLPAYAGNTPEAYLFDITSCKGDLNNDGTLSSKDDDAFLEALNYPATYSTEFRGALDGSRVWHGDVNCDGNFDANDHARLTNLINAGCCAPTCDFASCPADFDHDFIIGLSDLTRLLALYGKCEGDAGYDPNVDIYQDPNEAVHCIDLSDLVLLLSLYGQYCPCSLIPEEGFGMSAMAGSSGGAAPGISISRLEFADGAMGLGLHFAGGSPQAAWKAGGLWVAAENGATLRLVQSGSLPALSSAPWNVALTAISSPRASLADTPCSGNPAIVAGSYLSSSAIFDYDASTIDIAWLDAENGCSDGLIAVVAFDLAGLGGMGSGGGYSLYFSDAGPNEPGDVSIAHIRTMASWAGSGGEVVELNGEIFAHPN